MERVHFHREKTGLITLRMNHKHFKSGRFSYSSGQSVTSINWADGAIKKDQPTKGVATYKNLRGFLEALRTACNKHLEGPINADKLRAELDAVRKIAPLQGGFFDKWEEITATTKTAQGKPITAGTKRDKTQSMNMLMQFEPDATFQDITIEFYHRYCSWLLVKCPRTISKHIKNLKALMSEAHDRGIPVCMDFKKKSFRTPRVKTESTFLNEQEIMRIAQLKEGKGDEELLARLIPVRDLFVLACYTGQRVSDWHQLTPANIQNGFLRVVQKKGKKIVHIPIHPEVRRIWEKYSNELPPMMAEQKFNLAIKEVCKAAKLGMIFIEGEIQEKWKFIASHTARRSFASNCFMRKMDTLSIRTLTGHTTENSFLKYIGLDGLQHAQTIASHEFFNPELKIAV